MSISGAHPVLDLRASAMAHRVAAACTVEELLGAGDRQATGQPDEQRVPRRLANVPPAPGPAQDGGLGS